MLLALLARQGLSAIEKSIFLFFNQLTGSLEYIIWAFSQLGTLGFVVFAGLAALVLKRKLLSVYIFVGGITAYALAYGLKQLDFRERPVSLVDETIVRESSSPTLGFPSGHAAVATILCLIFLLYAPKKWRPFIVFAAIMVGISRLYLGVHLPLDILGGLAVGVFVYVILLFVKRHYIHDDYEIYSPTKFLERATYKHVLFLLALGLIFLFITSRYDQFEQSIQTLRDAQLWLVVLAGLCSVATFFFASLSYKSLVYRHIPLLKMFLVQIASSFASKLVPAGAGGLALNARFLTKQKQTITQAAAIAGINNIMGFVAHMSLLLLVVLLGASSFSEAFQLDVSPSPLVVSIFVAVIAICVATLLAFPKLRERLIHILHQMSDDFRQYSRHPRKLIGSYAASVCVTLSYVGALYASAHALGADLLPLQMLVVFTVGVAATAVTPTPGGIGGVEAALVASLSATGMETSQALAITLLYRLMTYWLPIIPGFIAFQYAVRKEYI